MASLSFPAPAISRLHFRVPLRSLAASLSHRRVPTPRDAVVLGALPSAPRRHKQCCRNRILRGVRAENSNRMEREPMIPPYNVLITGSTKGIGYALATDFLKAGDNVIICSRSVGRVDSAVQSLRKEFGEQHVELYVMLEKERMSNN